MENVQENNKNLKKKKKGTVVLVIIVIILTIIAGILGGLYIAGDGFDFFGNEETSSSSSNGSKSSSKTSKKTNKDKSDEDNDSEKEDDEDEDKKAQSGDKIDDNKPWIHDADYNSGNTVRKATTLEGTEYKSVDTLVLPYLNINSSYAEKINDELKELYEADYKMYGKTDSKNGYNSEFIAKISYEYSTSNKILSLLVKEDYGVVNGGLSTNYYTYNINLDTLDEAKLEDVCKEGGFSDKKDLEEKIDIAIENSISDGEYDEGASWNKKLYYLDKSKVFNVIVSDGTHKGPVVVKPNVTSNSKTKADDKKTDKNDADTTNQNPRTFEIPADNSPEPQPGPYGDGIEEIRKCLKDQAWIRDNVMMKQTVFGDPISGTQELTFMKVIGGKYSPMFLIQAYSETDISCQVFLVSYQGGKVVSKPMTAYPMHASHAGIVADPNKCVAVLAYMHMGYFADTLFDLTSGRPKEVLTIGGDDNIDSEGFYRVDGNSRVSISEEEYNNMHKQIDQYKLYDIGTELNDANVDEYVK